MSTTPTAAPTVMESPTVIHGVYGDNRRQAREHPTVILPQGSRGSRRPRRVRLALTVWTAERPGVAFDAVQRLLEEAGMVVVEGEALVVA